MTFFFYSWVSSTKQRLLLAWTPCPCPSPHILPKVGMTGVSAPHTHCWWACPGDEGWASWDPRACQMARGGFGASTSQRHTLGPEPAVQRETLTLWQMEAWVGAGSPMHRASRSPCSQTAQSFLNRSLTQRCGSCFLMMTQQGKEMRGKERVMGVRENTWGFLSRDREALPSAFLGGPASDLMWREELHSTACASLAVWPGLCYWTSLSLSVLIGRWGSNSILKTNVRIRQ